MIVYTKRGQREIVFDLAAFQGAVYGFPLFGAETYTDPFDSSVWYWENVTNDVDEVLGVSQEGEQLTMTTSIPDCILLAGSFHWDDANGHLYIHWISSVGDWSVAKAENKFAKIINGYASGYDNTSKNVFDGQYYKPIITGLSGLSTKVDPTKLGLISFESSSLTIVDEEEEFINVDKEDIVGVPIWIYYVQEGVSNLNNEDRIFTGILNGVKHDRVSATFDIIQSRLFENKPVCRNKITLSEWPNAGNQEGKLKPVAWGDIRRGKLVPVNSASLTTSGAGSAVLLLADPELDSLKAITKIYDKEDNEVTIDSFDLTACTATITKAAGISVSDLKKYKWEGQGYDIPGTYNNGLDIIKDAFFKISQIPFINSTYDTTQWNDQTLENNEPVGISIQSDKGFVEELVEPIMTSVQGVVQTLGDGRISFFSRDIEDVPSENILDYQQLDYVGIEESTKELVSEIVIEYSPDFVEKEPLQTIYSDETVVGKYGVDRRDPISPVKTILTTESDAILTAEEIAATSTDPQRIITVAKTNVNQDIRIFDIVGVDTGDYSSETIEYGEVLSIEPNYLNKNQTYILRVIQGYIAPESVKGFVHSNAQYLSTGHGTGGYFFLSSIKGFIHANFKYAGLGIDGHGVFNILREEGFCGHAFGGHGIFQITRG